MALCAQKKTKSQAGRRGLVRSASGTGLGVAALAGGVHGLVQSLYDSLNSLACSCVSITAKRRPHHRKRSQRPSRPNSCFQQAEGYLGTHTGGYAEYVAAPASEFVRKPKQIDFDTAASVPVAALTTWQGIFDHGKLATGQRILITGASGAVGSMAVQLAKNKAAHVIGIGSGRNEEFVRKLGAAEFIDYKRTKFEDTVSGVDVVFDTVGGDTQERAFQTLKRGGFLVSTVNPPSPDKAKEFSVTVAMVMMMPKPDQLAEINRLVEGGKLKVRVATVLPLAEVKKAHQLSASGHADGKIILRP